MSYIDEMMPGVTVNHSFLLGSKVMKYDKQCFEFVWTGGSGFHGAGMGRTKSNYIRYSHNNKKGFLGISLNSLKGTEFSDSLYEPVLLCLDKTEVTRLNFRIIKGENEFSYSFNDDIATKESQWRIIFLNDKEDKTDFLELHLTRTQIKNRIPEGFFPWISIKTKNLIKNNQCSRKIIHAITLMSFISS